MVAGGEYNSRHKRGSLMHSHPHKPWCCFKWSQYSQNFNPEAKLKNILQDFIETKVRIDTLPFIRNNTVIPVP
jgi:hypothetical protein